MATMPEPELSENGETGEFDDFAVETLQSLDVLARALAVKDAALQPTLDAIVEAAVKAVPAAFHAGLILVVRGEMEPQATTGKPPHELDQLQKRVDSGPCIDAARDQQVYRIDDTGSESRWPEFCTAAVPFDVSSMLCIPLWIDERTLGTLSLYSDQRYGFGSQDEPIAALFATLSAIALTGAQRADQLRTAMRNRDVIGQAKGILMERHRVTAEGAFTLLTQASQTVNRKLYAVCQHLVETGELLSSTGSSRRARSRPE